MQKTAPFGAPKEDKHMDFLTLARTRYSVRKYQPRPVEPEKLERILTAARVAPTAANIQPVRLLVLESKEGLTKLSATANIFGAPLAIVVCVDTNTAWHRPIDNRSAADIDASILSDHMMLEATDLGLGSLWVCYFHADKLRDAFRLPDGIEPVNILAIGYADTKPLDPMRHNTTRKELSETVVYETF